MDTHVLWLTRPSSKNTRKRGCKNPEQNVQIVRSNIQCKEPHDTGATYSEAYFNAIKGSKFI